MYIYHKHNNIYTSLCDKSESSRCKFKNVLLFFKQDTTLRNLKVLLNNYMGVSKSKDLCNNIDIYKIGGLFLVSLNYSSVINVIPISFYGGAFKDLIYIYAFTGKDKASKLHDMCMYIFKTKNYSHHYFINRIFADLINRTVSILLNPYNTSTLNYIDKTICDESCLHAADIYIKYTKQLKSILVGFNFYELLDIIWSSWYRNTLHVHTLIFRPDNNVYIQVKSNKSCRVLFNKTYIEIYDCIFGINPLYYILYGNTNVFDLFINQLCRIGVQKIIFIYLYNKPIRKTAINMYPITIYIPPCKTLAKIGNIRYKKKSIGKFYESDKYNLISSLHVSGVNMEHTIENALRAISENEKNINKTCICSIYALESTTSPHTGDKIQVLKLLNIITSEDSYKILEVCVYINSLLQSSHGELYDFSLFIPYDILKAIAYVRAINIFNNSVINLTTTELKIIMGIPINMFSSNTTLTHSNAYNDIYYIYPCLCTYFLNMFKVYNMDGMYNDTLIYTKFKYIHKLPSVESIDYSTYVMSYIDRQLLNIKTTIEDKLRCAELHLRTLRKTKSSVPNYIHYMYMYSMHAVDSLLCNSVGFDIRHLDNLICDKLDTQKDNYEVTYGINEDICTSQYSNILNNIDSNVCVDIIIYICTYILDALLLIKILNWYILCLDRKKAKLYYRRFNNLIYSITDEFFIFICNNTRYKMLHNDSIPQNSYEVPSLDNIKIISDALIRKPLDKYNQDVVISYNDVNIITLASIYNNVCININIHHAVNLIFNINNKKANYRIQKINTNDPNMIRTFNKTISNYANHIMEKIINNEAFRNNTYRTVEFIEGGEEIEDLGSM